MSVTQATLLGDAFGSKASGTVPIGGIIMWSGAIASIPTGWSLCNGTGGTPDLRNRFIVGAGSGYTPGNTGGSADATLVSHSHTFSGSTNVAGSHRHRFGYVPGPNWGQALDSVPSLFPDFGYSDLTMGAAGDHSHTVSGSTDTQGSAATNANLPPYYALAFIMRVS